MKKVLSLIAVAAMATMVSCGPSAEEKAKIEESLKRMQDSMEAAAKAMVEEVANEADVAADTTAAEAAPAEEAK